MYPVSWFGLGVMGCLKEAPDVSLGESSSVRDNRGGGIR